MSFPAGTPTALERLPQLTPTSSSNSPPLSSNSTESTDKATLLKPYGHILTHQEKKKQRMPKRKADSWPASILTDPDVLSLDDEGRFVLCKVCHVHYAVHGGKKPKPVIMNSGFRTRAWEVHKERTNSHRLHKKQDGPQARNSNSSTNASRHSDGEHKNNDKTPPKTAATTNQSPTPRPPLAKSHAEPVSRGFNSSPTVAPLMNKPLPSSAELQKKAVSPRRRMIRPPSDHALPRPWAQVDHEQARRPLGHDRIPPPPSDPPPANGRNTPQRPMSSEQADGLMRWRNMHDDVSRALGSSHKRSVADAYDGGDVTPPSMRMGDTEEFAGNNERVAKKLKSLDDEYDATVLKRQEAFFDRRSDMYKQYWGTLRDIYNSANHHPTNGHHGHDHSNVNEHPHISHSQHAVSRSSGSFRRQQETPAQAKESIDEFTTPDESGSSEELVKPVVVHDQALINALDRLTGVISKQFSDRYTQETSLLLDAMSKLTNAVDDLRMDHGAAMNRMIQLQEQNLQVSQELLRLKLEKHRKMSTHVVGRSVSGGGPGSAGSS